MTGPHRRSPFRALVTREIAGTGRLFRKKQWKKFDPLGLLLNLFLFAVLAFTFVVVLKGLIQNYGTVVFLDSSVSKSEQFLSRQRELLTLLLDVILLAGVVFGVGRINGSLAYNADLENLLRLPVTSQQLFLSKLLALYIGQFLFTATFVLPIGITFAVVNAQQIWFYFGILLVCFLLPVFSLFFAAILSVPVRLIRNRIKNRYLVLLILFVALLAGTFFVYSKILGLIESYFVSGQIKFVFNERTVKTMIAVAKYSFPVNWCSDMVFASDAVTGGVLVPLSAVLCVLLIVLLTRRLLSGYILQGSARKTVRRKALKIRAHSKFFALMKKEFIGVFRNPDYAFSYFSTALVLPFMVYICIGLLSQLVFRMVGMRFGFELSLLVITMFSVLTNTFCATNVSRDGDSFVLNKSLAVSGRSLILSKVAFCSVTNVVSLLAACILLASTGYVKPGEGTIIFFVALLVTTGEIFMATRKDLNHPQFRSADLSGENKSMSFVIVVNLLVSVLIGGLAIALSLILSVRNPEIARPVVVAAMFVCSAVFCGICALYLFRGLGKKIYETVDKF